MSESEPQESAKAATSPRRSSRALLNDDAIRRAAVNLILRSGIDSISFRDVGREAGLTHGAVYARFEDIEELLVDVWSSVLCRRLISLLDAARIAASNPTDESVEALLDFVRNAEKSDVAAVVVLFASRRFVVLHEEVESFIHDHLENPEGLSQDIHSRTMTLFAVITVKIFSNLAYGIDKERFEFFRIVVLESLKISPESIMEPPSTTFAIHSAPFERDGFVAHLSYQTHSAVARSGYHKATISRISRRASCSPGAIYKLYPSKDDLVVGAIRHQMHGPGMTAMRLSHLLDEGVLAQFLHAATNERDPVRTYFVLEMFMASAHNSTIRNALGSQLARLIKADSYVVDLPPEERRNFKFMINETIVLVLGVSFLSTITDKMSDVNFNQIAEPIRRTLLRLFPSWPSISGQLREMAASLPSSTGNAEMNLATN